jgi:hypothetical protein
MLISNFANQKMSEAEKQKCRNAEEQKSRKAEKQKSTSAIAKSEIEDQDLKIAAL